MSNTQGCQGIRDEIEEIKQDIRDLQRMLRNATPPEKKDIAAAIKAAQAALKRKEKELRDRLLRLWTRTAPPVS